MPINGVADLNVCQTECTRNEDCTAVQWIQEDENFNGVLCNHVISDWSAGKPISAKDDGYRKVCYLRAKRCQNTVFNSDEEC